MLQLEEAQQRISALVQPLGAETVSLAQAFGRVLGEPVVSGQDLPPFDNSAMDGYAVRAEDVVLASPEKPISLRLVGRVTAGQVFRGRLGSGECVRLFTGSPLPAGADAVIMQEDTQPADADPQQRLFLSAPTPWENVRFKGEDVKRGATVLEPGQRLTAGQVSLLAALGCGQVAVGRRPVLGLLATGSELREAGRPLGPGEIYESNRTGLAALGSAMGAVTRSYPLVSDDQPALEAALSSALTECDALVTSGGVSVGEMDLVKDSFQRVGGQLAFWRVALRPGKPFALGTCGNKLLFGLPGNPVSAFVTFLLLVRPALLKWQGAELTDLPASLGRLTEALPNDGDRRHFARVTIDSAGQVRPSGRQASHLLHSLASANGLVDVPPRTTLPVGSAVSVLRWD